MRMHYVQQIEALKPIFRDADYVDVKVVEGEVTLREFIATALTYQPGWMRLLYGIRAGFVRLLGMRQKEIFPTPPPLRLETVPMVEGQPAYFFKVRLAQEDAYWVVEMNDKHLKAGLGVVVEPLSERRRRFYMVTIVHYNNWAGPVYFNVIRPFHHLVVGSMARAGVRGKPGAL